MAGLTKISLLRLRVFFITFVRNKIKDIIMNTKLTLSIEETVIKKAKEYAKKNRHSLSEIIENYLKALTKGQKDEKGLSPLVRSLKGSFKKPGSYDYKKTLQEELSKKHL